jgi:uncharacterized membrane protein
MVSSALLLLLGLLLVAPALVALWAFFRTTDNKKKTAALEKRLKLLAQEVIELKRQQEKVLKQLSDPDYKPESKTADEKTDAEMKPEPKGEGEGEGEPEAEDSKDEKPLEPEQTSEPLPPFTSVPTGFKKPASSQPQAARSPRKKSMEQAVGAQWSVWVGGLALALGAIFLVKHSIDQGYLTPAVRILFSTIMAAALLAGGEWMRRNDVLNDVAGVPGAYIPGALTAAGVVASFATIYAAYALYHFLGPIPAFVLLALVSLGALGASIIHGPGLAAMGLAGAYITPVLISTDHPSAWTLFTYLLFVSAANFIAAQMRSWLWLAVGAVAASTVWGLLWFAGPWMPYDGLPMSVYILGLLLMALPFLKQTEPKLSGKQQQSLFAAVEIADWPVALALGSIAVLAVILLRYANYSSLSLSVFALVIGLFLLSTWRWLSLGMLSIFGAILFAHAFLSWHIPYLTDVLGEITDLWTPPQRGQLAIDAVTPPEIIAFLTFGTLFSMAFAIVGFMLVRRYKGEPLFALVSTLVPLGAFAYANWRITDFDTSISFGLVGVALAAAATLATDRLDRESRERRFEVSAGIYATAAVATLALATTIMLEKGWLTIALAVLTPALAVIARKRKMKVLGILAGALATIIAARVFFEPRILGPQLGTTPIFNWLLYGYGVPAIALGLAASIFRKDRDDWVPDLLEAGAILFTTLLIFLQIRHWLYDGNIYSPQFNLVENGLQTSVWVTLSLGLHKMHQATGRRVPEAASNLLGLVGMVTALLGLLLLTNPLFTNKFLGSSLLFNDLILGYLLLALLFLFLFQQIAGERQKYYVMAVGFAAFVLMFTYLSLELRVQFQGGQIGLSHFHPTSDPEWYAYSALWLVFGLVLLGIGIYLRQQQIRFASLALIGLVIVKVFLSDMAHLTGIWRAFSFIGLGLALVGIGWLYQRIIIPQGADSDDDHEDEEDDNGEEELGEDRQPD